MVVPTYLINFFADPVYNSKVLLHSWTKSYEINRHETMLEGANPTMCFLHDEPINKFKIPPSGPQTQVQAFPQPSIYLLDISLSAQPTRNGTLSLKNISVENILLRYVSSLNL